MTFDQCSAGYIIDNGTTWKNPKHRQQWKNTLATYVSPVCGAFEDGPWTWFPDTNDLRESRVLQ
jgi:hypothetical protein